MSDDTKRSFIVRDGVSCGAVLAMVISWSINKSVLWAILHSICSWLYVIYYLCGWAE